MLSVLPSAQTACSICYHVRSVQYAEFSALQSSSAELHTQLETLQPDISALKNIRKYIDMVLNKQQLSAPGGKTPEKESVLKKLNDSKAALEQKKLQPQQKATEHTL